MFSVRYNRRMGKKIDNRNVIDISTIMWYSDTSANENNSFRNHIR